MSHITIIGKPTFINGEIKIEIKDVSISENAVTGVILKLPSLTHDIIITREFIEFYQKLFDALK